MKKESNPVKACSVFFRALSDPTRLDIMLLLAHGELCVCQLEAALGAPQAKISRHLAYLRRHKMVKVRSQWKWKYYSPAEPKNRLEAKISESLKEWPGRKKRFKAEFLRMKKCPAGPAGAAWTSLRKE